MALLQFLNPEALARSPGYTQIVVSQRKKTVYISGQVATNAAGELVGRGDLRRQAEQVYHNLEVALAAAGASFADVAKMTTYLVGLNAESLAIVREVRRGFLPRDEPPASTLVAVAALAIDGLLIEIEAIASVD